MFKKTFTSLARIAVELAMLNDDPALVVNDNYQMPSAHFW